MKLFPILSPVIIGADSTFIYAKVNQASSDLAYRETDLIADTFKGGAGKIEGLNFVDVVSVEISHYDGLVYNFETESGLVLANGIITHNCRCRLIAEIDFGKKLARVEGFR